MLRLVHCSKFSMKHPAMVPFGSIHGLNVLGSMVIDVSSTKLQVNFVTSAGNVADVFVITKEATPSV